LSGNSESPKRKKTLGEKKRRGLRRGRERGPSLPREARWSGFLGEKKVPYKRR